MGTSWSALTCWKYAFFIFEGGLKRKTLPGFFPGYAPPPTTTNPTLCETRSRVRLFYVCPPPPCISPRLCDLMLICNKAFSKTCVCVCVCARSRSLARACDTPCGCRMIASFRALCARLWHVSGLRKEQYVCACLCENLLPQDGSCLSFSLFLSPSLSVYVCVCAVVPNDGATVLPGNRANNGPPSALRKVGVV